MLNKVVKLAYDLCRIPSVTGNEAQALDFLVSWLKDAGLLVEKIPVDEHRFNIFAYFTKRSQYSAIYCTHIDTVAPFIAPHIDDKTQILFGRGACDAKGIIAAMVLAVLEEKALGFDDLALLFTVGEEESSDGAKVCNAALFGRSRFLVVGEPTELKAAYGQKGSLVFDLEADGIEAHSSRPHLGDSAIHKLVRDINKLLDYPWPTHEHFGETLINFGEVSGGTMRNVLAGYAVAKAIMRTSERSTKLSSIINSLISDGVRIKLQSSSDPFSYFVPDGFDSFLAGFGSDAPYLQDIGRPILLGPGSLDLAHKQNEHVGFLELLSGVFAYQRVANIIRKIAL